MFRIHMLAADHGDCLWVEYGSSQPPKRILIDAGTVGIYKRSLLPKIQAVVAAEGKCTFELFVVTHVDADHIGGAIEFLKQAPQQGVAIKEIWFNGYFHLSNTAPAVLGAKQGEMLTPLVQNGPWTWNKRFKGLAVMVPDAGKLPSFTFSGLKITLLSPTFDKLQKLKPEWEKDIRKEGLVPGQAYKLPVVLPDGFLGGDVQDWADMPFTEDKTAPNGSSIAFLAEYGGKRVVFGADAHPSVLIQNAQRLPVAARAKPLDAFKLPHHGSQNNVSKELVAAFPAAHYLVSTNGGTYRHPDKEAIARVLVGRKAADKTLHFNCPSDVNAQWKNVSLQQKAKWNYQVNYGTSKGGWVLDL
ncbi:MBL fold metallo-hydrolase [Rhodoferax sp. 4810]|nr:MBL fold metallo-hydrolase [Rhodoferax jenense]